METSKWTQAIRQKVVQTKPNDEMRHRPGLTTDCEQMKNNENPTATVARRNNSCIESDKLQGENFK